MNKLLKYALIAIVSIILMVLLAMAYFAATFNPNDYKQDIIDLVKKEKDRTLTIDGDITLAFWPKLGANLGKLSISEHQSDKEFASINSAKVALAVLPLLKNSLVVDTVYIDGAKANIVKYKDGSTNYDDLMSAEEDSSESTEIQFNVQGINITDSAVSYTDETQDATYRITDFNLATGHVALAEPVDVETSFKVSANQPAINIEKQVKGEFLYDPEHKHFKVAGLDSLITGDMFGGKNMEVKAVGDIDVELEKLAVLVNSLSVQASGDFDGAKQTVDLTAPSINIHDDSVS